MKIVWSVSFNYCWRSEHNHHLAKTMFYLTCWAQLCIYAHPHPLHPLFFVSGELLDIRAFIVVNSHFNTVITTLTPLLHGCRARLVLLLTDYQQLNLDVVCRFVAPDMWVPHFVMDLIWGWLISCLSTTISVQGCDLRPLASNARAGVRSGMMKGSTRRFPVDTADWWRLSASISPCRRACVSLSPKCGVRGWSGNSLTWFHSRQGFGFYDSGVVSNLSEH